jgi:hypothetical protein
MPVNSGSHPIGHFGLGCQEIRGKKNENNSANGKLCQAGVLPVTTSAKRKELDPEARREAIAKRLKDAPQAPPRQHKVFGSPRPFRAKPKPYRPDNYTTGRPTLYGPEYCQKVIDLMSKGYDLTAFAGSIRVSRESVYSWMDAHAEFADAVKIAKGCRLFGLQEKLLTTKQGVGVTAAIFALKNADPENWQDRYNTETTVTHRIEHLSDQQLLEIAARGRTIEHDPRPMLQHANEGQPVADDGNEGQG